MRGKPKTADCTDLHNSERFVDMHKGTLRFVGAWAKWLDWDGRRWVTDATGAAERAAKRTVQKMLAEVSGEHAASLQALERAAEDEELVEVAKKRATKTKPAVDWAIQSHDAPRIRAMVQLARSADVLAVTHQQLDANPWLLNVANGTLDLHVDRFELRPHRAEDLITKLAPVAFDPDAKCPTWDAFLDRAMGGNEDLLAFVQRMSGYALTGVIREHVLGFLFGGGANGKSTFMSTMHALLGDYAARAPRSLLFATRGDRHETELTTLFGARLVSCAEIDEAAVFDEALTKDLTGGDPITARRMREDHWTFSPTHKLFIAGNHKPRVRGADDGIWRRIRLIPWTITVPPNERDTELVDKLRTELAGILAWAVRGCLDWQREGLGEPIEVTAATNAYRDESDPLREFFELHCIFEATARTPRRHIREAYESYCKENGAEPLGAKRFAEGLRRHGVTDGCVKCAGKVMDGWRGVRLATEAERDRRESVGDRDEVGGRSRVVEKCARARVSLDNRGPTSYQTPTPYSGGVTDAADGVATAAPHQGPGSREQSSEAPAASSVTPIAASVDAESDAAPFDSWQRAQGVA